MVRCPNCGQENPAEFRFCGTCGTQLGAAPPAREVRKTVTVLFCDVTGSTAMGARLDPESTRRVMARYFDAMRETIKRHGGTVEKFIGDAVMAVFGVPVVHEDDALRAVRAASDMRTALEQLNDELARAWGVRIESRIGLNTGEVVTGEGDTLATGDAVNVAARLEQGAAAGETLLGESTYRLVRDAVTAEPVGPLSAKGKAEPLRAFRLTEVVAGAEFIRRRLDSPLVGRENELAQLQRAFDHAASERVAYQFTLLGPAGIGKSRLVRELHDQVDATLLSGRCLPYGEGITYWPLAEIEAFSEINFEANRDEIALHTRRTLERLARERSLLVVFDDLQWAEPTFLDLVDHVTDLARDAPMLLVCVARPDLLDVRPGWGGGKLNATTMLLEALTENEAAELVDNLLLAQVDSSVKERIATAAEGNPLYVEEMLAMVTEDGGDLAIPPTIHALLAARLDRLGSDERAVIESAAIEGQEFRREALAALVPEPLVERLAETLQSLVRKDVIRPAHDETFRFKHLLLRDAAYESVPKERRAELHERFADWLGMSAPELAEIRGYHLEQAFRYRAQLGPLDDRTLVLARRAAALLADAGRRALVRSDVPATINLLERAVQLLPEGDPDAVASYPDLASAIAEGGDLERAAELYAAAEELGDEATRLRSRMRRISLELMRGGGMAEAWAPLEECMSEAERLGDEAVFAEGLRRLGILSLWLGDNDKADQLLRSSLEHAESAGDLQLMDEARYWIAFLLLWGPMPVEQALRECRRLEQADSGQLTKAELRVAEGALMGLTGDFEQARKPAAEGRQVLLELGQKVQYAVTGMAPALVELAAGEAPVAERILRESYEILDGARERGYLSTVAALLAVSLAWQDRFDEAETFADTSKRVGASDDLSTQLYWRVAMAHVVAARGEMEEAGRLATETVELAKSYNSFDAPITTLAVAEFLEPAAARAVLERSLAGAEAKGNVVTAEQARAKLAALS
jgi:class 3 adenylate cyclase/tetratricopeptide (TPR) repeat protein